MNNVEKSHFGHILLVFSMNQFEKVYIELILNDDNYMNYMDTAQYFVWNKR
mgnify:CR=1 FL=1